MINIINTAINLVFNSLNIFLIAVAGVFAILALIAAIREKWIIAGRSILITTVCTAVVLLSKILK